MYTGKYLFNCTPICARSVKACLSVYMPSDDCLKLSCGKRKELCILMGSPVQSSRLLLNPHIVIVKLLSGLDLSTIHTVVSSNLRKSVRCLIYWRAQTRESSAKKDELVESYLPQPHAHWIWPVDALRLALMSATLLPLTYRIWLDKSFSIVGDFALRTFHISST